MFTANPAQVPAWSWIVKTQQQKQILKPTYYQGPIHCKKDLITVSNSFIRSSAFSVSACMRTTILFSFPQIVYNHWPPHAGVMMLPQHHCVSHIVVVSVGLIGA